jgi:hypothetical protein
MKLPNFPNFSDLSIIIYTINKQLRQLFIYFLNLGFLKRFLATYVGCWLGFISMVLFSKMLVSLTTKKVVVVASDVASKKFDVVSHAVSSTVNNGVASYFSIVLSYFISNSTACIIILMVFPLIAYIYKKEIKQGKSSFEEYLNSVILFYIILIINPLTGILGYNIDIKDLVVIIPHGIFEFAGFALSITTSILLAEKILPINSIKFTDSANVSSSKNITNSIDITEFVENRNVNNINNVKTNNIIIILNIIAIFLLIGIAACFEPIDWLIYGYAKSNNLNLVYTIFIVYKSIFYYLLSNIW